METIPSSPKLPSISVIGWSTIVGSVILIVTDLVGLLSYSMVDSLGETLNAPLLSQYLSQSMKKVMDLYAYSRWMTWYEIFFFAFVIIAATQFLRLRAWGRKALEAACWVGLLNAVVDTLISYVIWQDMKESLSMMLRGIGGGQYTNLNPIGFVTIVLGFFLWIIPSVGLIFYLRRPRIREVVNQ